MYIPTKALTYRKVNYRDLTELKQYADMAGLPFEVASGEAIEAGNLETVAVGHLETYLYMCGWDLVPKSLLTHTRLRSVKIYEPKLGVAARQKAARRARYDRDMEKKRAAAAAAQENSASASAGTE